MKKIISLLLALCMIMALSACGSNSADQKVEAPNSVKSAIEESVSAESDDVSIVPPVEEESNIETPVANLSSSGALGDYEVAIGDIELCKDYYGKTAALVSYTFTNNSEEAVSAMIAVNTNAYQNGLELDTPFIVDDSLYNADDSMKEIQPGYSIDVKAAFALTSETAPLEFEVSETFSLENERLGKVFEISEGGVTELSKAPGAETAEEIGNYAISIISYELTEDYKGNQAIIINLGFTNNSDKTTSFMNTMDVSCFQDGIELESAIVHDSGSGESQMRNVQPGAGHAVTIARLITSETSVIDIEIEEYFSLSDNVIKAQINLAN